MHVEQQIEFDRAALFTLSFLSLCVVFFGFYMFTTSHESTSGQVFIYGLGLVSIIFFGYCGFQITKKLLSHSPALIFNEDGFIDNSSALSAGFVPWCDVSHIGEYEVGNQTFVSVYLKEPKKYINKVKGYKSILIKFNTLIIGTDDLHQIFQDYSPIKA